MPKRPYPRFNPSQIPRIKKLIPPEDQEAIEASFIEIYRASGGKHPSDERLKRIFSHMLTADPAHKDGLSPGLVKALCEAVKKGKDAKYFKENGLYPNLYVSKQKNLKEIGMKPIELSTNEEFCNFFLGSGHGNSKSPIGLVMPKWLTNTPIEPIPQTSEEEGAKPEGVSGYLPFEEVKAAIFLASTLTSKTNRPVKLVQSNGFNEEGVFIILGLGFTSITKLMAKNFDPIFYEIEPSKRSRKAEFKNKTDDFLFKAPDSLGGGYQYVSLRTDRDIALIVRMITPGIPPKYICAGRSAPGTCAAAHFLINRWTELKKLYEDIGDKHAERSLGIVIEHNTRKDSSAWITDYDIHSPSGLPFTAKICDWGDESKTQCIQWADCKGFNLG